MIQSENLLYYGDNLDVLRRHGDDESIDLVYLDPPFNSNATYNVLFAEQDGSRAAAQIKAFEDTWQWDQAAAEAYEEVVEAGGKPSEAMRAFRQFLGDSNMLAYLAMMAPRLIELRRVLKPTGSIYLHCDPVASHYLKMLMDAVFGTKYFRNEVIWRRTGAHGKAKRFAPLHDVVLFYTKSKDYTWTYPKRPFMRGHVKQHFVKDHRGYRTDYFGNVLTGPGTRDGESGEPWQGFDPTAKGRHWAIPKSLIGAAQEDMSGLTQHEKMDRLHELGHIRIVEGQAWPVYQIYINEHDGQAMSDIWAYQPYTEETVFGTSAGVDADVRWLSTRDQERLGYPTQKPEGLLERIIQASSNEGDVVLDPFCGCGTAVAVAQRLGRRWIGIDITHLAVNLIRHRLRDAFGDGIAQTYQVIGEPTSLPDAATLAAEEPFQFQAWALGLVGARVASSAKKGADKGIDGRLYFHDEKEGGKTKQVIFSVKAGKATVAHLRDLRGVLTREKAEIGVLISMQKPTKPMRSEAAGAGFYDSPWGTKHPKMQLLTIEELLDGKGVDMPPSRDVRTFKKATKAKKAKTPHPQLPLGGEPETEAE